jgi:hypothetical protein
MSTTSETPTTMKCIECNGTGEREINVDGMDCPTSCIFCEGTGVEDTESQIAIAELIIQKAALDTAISVVRTTRDFPNTVKNLTKILGKILDQIEEIRNREEVTKQ